MDVRKKLVELQLQADIADNISENGTQHREFIADLMIANGVTVQEWIPVTERLPEWGERVICTDGYAVFEQYRVGLSCVYGMWDRGGSKSPMQEVTHWMPLPNPPKGE